MYTGTHDNDTAAGWFAGAPAHEREFFARYRGPGEDSVPWELMRMAWRSVARWAIAPVQDPLELGSDARMNEPGTTAGNWRWRLPADFFERGAHAIGPRLAELNDVYERRGPALAPPATPGSANPA
jgi:4-alpha-glucanotransferase